MGCLDLWKSQTKRARQTALTAKKKRENTRTKPMKMDKRNKENQSTKQKQKDQRNTQNLIQKPATESQKMYKRRIRLNTGNTTRKQAKQNLGTSRTRTSRQNTGIMILKQAMPSR